MFDRTFPSRCAHYKPIETKEETKTENLSVFCENANMCSCMLPLLLGATNYSTPCETGSCGLRNVASTQTLSRSVLLLRLRHLIHETQWLQLCHLKGLQSAGVHPRTSTFSGFHS